MKENEDVKRYGEEAWARKLQKVREGKRDHPKIVREPSHQTSRKGGKYYERHQLRQRTGVSRGKRIIPVKHAKQLEREIARRGGIL